MYKALTGFSSIIFESNNMTTYKKEKKKNEKKKIKKAALPKSELSSRLAGHLVKKAYMGA